MNKNRMLIILLPMVFVVFGFVIFLDSGGRASEPLKASQLPKVHVGVDSDKEEPYTDKLDMIDKKTDEEILAERKRMASTAPSEFFNKALKKDQPEQNEEIQEEVIEQPVEKEPEVVTKVIYVEKEAEKKPEPDPTEQKRRRAGFNSISSSNNSSSASTDKGQLLAVIHRDTKVKTGEVVKLRVTENSTINSTSVAANTFIDGIVRFGNNRVYIDVKGFSINGRYVDEKLEAYSMNGGEGLEANITIEKKAGQQVLSEGISGVEDKVNLPVNMQKVIGGAGQDKIENQQVQLDAGTKMYLR